MRIGLDRLAVRGHDDHQECCDRQGKRDFSHRGHIPPRERAPASSLRSRRPPMTGRRRRRRRSASTFGSEPTTQAVEEARARPTINRLTHRLPAEAGLLGLVDTAAAPRSHRCRPSRADGQGKSVSVPSSRVPESAIDLMTRPRIRGKGPSSAPPTPARYSRRASQVIDIGKPTPCA